MKKRPDRGLGRFFLGGGENFRVMGLSPVFVSIEYPNIPCRFRDVYSESAQIEVRLTLKPAGKLF